MSGRSPERLDAAVAAIRGVRPAASVETLVMDQSSLDAVDAGADAAARRRRRSTASSPTRAWCTPRTTRARVDRRQRARARHERARALRTARADAAAPRRRRAHRVARLAVDAALDVPRRRPAARARLRLLARLRPVEDRVAGRSAFELDRRLRAAGVAGGERRRAPGLLDQRPHADGAGRERAERAARASPTRCRPRGRRASTAAPRSRCTRSPRPASRAGSSGARSTS